MYCELHIPTRWLAAKQAVLQVASPDRRELTYVDEYHRWLNPSVNQLIAYSHGYNQLCAQSWTNSRRRILRFHRPSTNVSTVISQHASLYRGLIIIRFRVTEIYRMYPRELFEFLNSLAPIWYLRIMTQFFRKTLVTISTMKFAFFVADLDHTADVQ